MSRMRGWLVGRWVFVALWVFPATLQCAAACKALLTTEDARQLATAIPNARAFVRDQHARVTAVVLRAEAGAVLIRVMARQPLHTPVEVGVYTVNLRTGRVTDDDQEPADDETTLALRDQLMKRHCR